MEATGLPFICKKYNLVSTLPRSSISKNGKINLYYKFYANESYPFIFKLPKRLLKYCFF